MIKDDEKTLVLAMLEHEFPLYVRVTDAARLLGISRQTLYHWRDRHGAGFCFEAARKGKLVMVDIPALIRWARSHDRGPLESAWWQ
jgi:transposase-like protein